MANHKSSIKRIRTTQKRTEVNKSRLSRIRTFVKKVELAIGAGDAKEAKTALKAAQPELHRGVTKGIFKKNTVARKISRLAQKIKKLEKAS